MICELWYIREIEGTDNDYIYYQCQLPYVPPEKTIIKASYNQEFLLEEPFYNIAERRMEIFLSEIEESEVDGYLAKDWRRKLVEEEVP